MALITDNHLEGQVLGQVLLFQAADGQVSLDVRLEADTVWLSQAQMAELFGRERSVISKHIGTVSRTILDDTLPGGPMERTITYVAPWVKCDRVEDYRVGWEYVERGGIRS